MLCIQHVDANCVKHLRLNTNTNLFIIVTCTIHTISKQILIKQNVSTLTNGLISSL